MGESDLQNLKIEYPDRWKFLTEKLAYPYESLKSIEEYEKPFDKLKKEDLFSKLKNNSPSDKEIESSTENF